MPPETARRRPLTVLIELLSAAAEPVRDLAIGRVLSRLRNRPVDPEVAHQLRLAQHAATLTRISLRIEASNMVLFEEDDYQNVQSYTAGLGTYF